MRTIKRYRALFILVLGIALISTGIFMLNVPAGFICTGILLTILDFLTTPVKEGVGK